MSKIKIEIDKEIFRSNFTYCRGIVAATNLKNQAESTKLAAMLQSAIEKAAANPINLGLDDRIVDWDSAHQKVGSNPNKFPPAHKNLVKRSQKAGAKLPFINNVVAIMNYNSITSVLPVGGDDIDRAGNHLLLRHAVGDETFTPLGSTTPEHPDAGEIIYVVADSNEVMCRRWNWRNSLTTAITEDTTAIVMNIDALGEDSEARAISTRDRVAEMLIEFCQAEVRTTLLTPEFPIYEFTL